MAKRKRAGAAANASSTPTPAAAAAAAAATPAKKARTKATKPVKQSEPQRGTNEPLTLQIVTGSYDRVLHGMVATVSPKGEATFADSFLFNAHPSAVRCVALSPPSNPIPGQEQRVLLASGSSDPKINIYNLSAHPPRRQDKDEMSTAALRPILENSKNRELGLYNPHDSTVTKLSFPTRSKLISSSEDSTIAVAKTRNWEQMSTIKAPIPKAQGRPSGDTAPLGGTPAGVNDFAVHPSMKLLISVSRGERCMRLWNLLTGKKAAVLNFSRALLQEVGEGRHSTGEGRKVVWGSAADSEEFAVGFDRDIVVFGMDSQPKCRVMPNARTKIHHFEYISLDDASESTLIAVSTEDGRIVFCSTREGDLTRPEPSDSEQRSLSTSRLVAQVGGKDAGVTSRIKAFNVFRRTESGEAVLYIVGGGSDGNVRLWRVDAKELDSSKADMDGKTKQVGKLLGTYSTNNRITCLAAFVMIPRPEGMDDSEDGLKDVDSSEEEGSSDEGE